MALKNGLLTYSVNGVKYSHALYVMTLEQPHNLNVNVAQTRMGKQIFPRAYTLGDTSISGRCRSQEEYQELGRFIRQHHRALMNMPDNEVFTRYDNTNPGYQRLLRFEVPSEGVSSHGYIKNFALLKKGVFDPAPEYHVVFTTLFDAHSSNVIVSHQLQKYFSARDPNSLISRRDVGETPFDAITTGVDAAGNAIIDAINNAFRGQVGG